MATSSYFEKFLPGAPLLPRCFWFVHPAPDNPEDSTAPLLETSSEAYEKSKKQWSFMARGRIEKEYLFVTVHPKLLSSFLILDYRLLFLPITAAADGTAVLNSAQLLKEGKLFAARWMKDIEQTWKASLPQDEGSSSLYTRMNRCQELRNQNPKSDIVVVCNATGPNLTAALHRPARGKGCEANGFIADQECYYYYPQTPEEGEYLCSMLNSDVVNQLARAYEPETARTARNIRWRPFEACLVPPFSHEDSDHVRLAGLGRHCRTALETRASRAEATARKNRPAARRVVRKEMSAINQIVASILRKQGQRVEFAG